MRSFLAFLLKTLFRVRLTGDLAGVGRGEPLLFVSNHSSRLDPLLLGLFLPRNPVVVVPTNEPRSRLLRRALCFVRHESLDVGSAPALKRILKLLRAGTPVVLFPEGRMARSGAVMKIYPVPALAALKSAAAVVPVNIDAAAATGGFVSRAFSGVSIRVFPAKRIETDADTPRRRRMRASSRLAALMRDAALEAYDYKPLFEHFLDACAAHGRRTTVMEDQNAAPQTYGEMLRASLALARLMKRFTRDKECVGVLLPNVMVTPALVLGLSATGRVPVMFNYTSGPASLRVARSAAGVRVVVTSRKFIAQARLHSLLEAFTDCAIVYLEDLRAQFGLADKLWLLAFALHFPRRAVAVQAADDPAVVLFTSGSEGEPKGVVLSHRAIVANVIQIRTVIEFTPDDKILNPLPLYHAYSFTAGMMLSLITGTRLHLYISPLHYRAIPEIAYRNECTVLFGTSTFLSYYAANAGPLDFSRVRYVISGGEKLAPEVARVWAERFGLRIFEGYGCTECAPVISLATPAAHRSNTVGQFLPGIEYRIEPVTGIEKGGVLHLRGPNVLLGHYAESEPGVLQACRSAFGAGWYNTGDIVEVDEDGFVTVHGRMRRFAKIAGEMISLDHIEHVARAASPSHFHAAVLKVEEYGGETTVLFTSDPDLDRITLQKTARALGSRDLAVARQIMRVRELPVLRNGKTDYVSLGRMAQCAHAREEGDILRAASRSLQQERIAASGASEVR